MYANNYVHVGCSTFIILSTLFLLIASVLFFSILQVRLQISAEDGNFDEIYSSMSLCVMFHEKVES